MAFGNKFDDNDLREKRDSAVNLGTTKERMALATNKVKAGKSLAKASGGMSTGDKAAMAQKGMQLAGIGPDAGDTSTEGGALSGAASGAAMGAKFGGVYGAAVGAVVGGVAGGLDASAKQKAAAQAAKQRAKAQHAQNLGRIEQEKDSKIQNALESMKSAFGRNLNQKTKVSL